MISKSTKSAIKAVIYLVRQSSEANKVLVRDMYQEIRVSEAYLAKLLQTLSRHGLVSSAKGRGGGFYLNAANLEHSLMDVVRVIDGKESVEACVLGIRECSEVQPCAVHHVLGPAKADFNTALYQTRFRDLAQPESSPFDFPM
ncbi:Rrf2 family transcriptional regulator [Robiginitalea sp. M366]|uniref:RrF2 family transcriptional regulator n=1 Tax=Robiginitalea aestuariiviva TaxID=3036903 RepID=UPI00240DE435|nr:Rrf2 family transcriptional regulator [Robiginitalea aestuariiviva]MDG1573330.1 Rrf2 family transcriptional regulator [Robiginitalea aestuariiviva]